MNDVELPPIEATPEPLAAADAPAATTRGVSQCAHKPGQNQCFGMCGPGCSCWKWVCGDCCWHKGCAAHDSDCRKCSWRNPWACTKCASFASFFTGGGCAT